jgi:hypothetical protein
MIQFLIEKDLARMRAQTEKLNEFTKWSYQLRKHRHNLSYQEFCIEIYDNFRKSMGIPIEKLKEVIFHKRPFIDLIKNGSPFLKSLDDHHNDIARYYSDIMEPRKSELNKMFPGGSIKFSSLNPRLWRSTPYNHPFMFMDDLNPPSFWQKVKNLFKRKNITYLQLAGRGKKYNQ